MWLMTSFGFFSIVRKGESAELTIRSRTRGDLDRLRAHYLPELGPSLAHAGTDYPWRAVVAPWPLQAAMARIVEDLDYPNFKDEVALTLGKDRAKRYGKVWSALYDLPEDLPEPAGHEVLPWPGKPPQGLAPAYGGVVIDPQGHVLMREVAGHFDGYVWSFAKGRPEPGEAPRACALREVQEETGVAATVLTALPGEFAGGTTVNRYFLMGADRRQVSLDFRSPETAGLRWATPDEARRLIGETTHAQGRQRDLAVLDAALACLPCPPPLARPIAMRGAWKSRPLPALRRSQPLDLSFTPAEMGRLWRGWVPGAMEEKWFARFEDGVLHLFRSWTGLAVFRVHFEPAATGWKAVRLEASAHPGHHPNTDPRQDLEQAVALLQQLVNGPDEPTV